MSKKHGDTRRVIGKFVYGNAIYLKYWDTQNIFKNEIGKEYNLTNMCNCRNDFGPGTGSLDMV